MLNSSHAAASARAAPPPPPPPPSQGMEDMPPPAATVPLPVPPKRKSKTPAAKPATKPATKPAAKRAASTKPAVAKGFPPLKIPKRRAASSGDTDLESSGDSESESSSDDDSSDDGEESVYSVEGVTDHRGDGAKREYLVKWAGYAETTWVPAFDISKDLVDAYLSEHPTAKPVCPRTHTVLACSHARPRTLNSV